MNSLDTLHIWNGLELAKDKAHPYGGDVAEVYAQHFLPENADGDPWVHAGRNLHNLLGAFCHYHSVRVTVNGRQLGDWMDSYKFIHKCDVRVFKNESVQSAREGGSAKISTDSAEHYQVFPQEEKVLYPNQSTKRKTRSLLGPDKSEQIIGELERCKIETPQKNTEPRLPKLLKRLWKAMSSQQNRKAAL